MRLFVFEVWVDTALSITTCTEALEAWVASNYQDDLGCAGNLRPLLGQRCSVECQACFLDASQEAEKIG